MFDKDGARNNHGKKQKPYNTTVLQEKGKKLQTQVKITHTKHKQKLQERCERDQMNLQNEVK